MRPKHLIPACAFLASSAVAQVYVGDVTFVSNTFEHDALAGLTTSIPVGQGAAGFWFDSVDSGGLATQISAANIAELYSLFIVPEGTPFDAAYVSTHTAIIDNSGTLPSHTLPYTDGQSVLFAYWDDRASFGGAGAVGEADASDLFGWMRVDFFLTTNPDTLDPVVRWTIENSATARGGILAGTYTQVPEPACFPLLGGATALLVTATRRRAHSAFVRS